MRTLSLTAPASAVLDGSGNGTVSTGPRSAGEIWYPESVSVSSSGAPAAGSGTSCSVYAGAAVMPGTFVDRTVNPAGAASSLISGQKIYPGQQVFAVFANAGDFATATIVISGTRTVP